MRDSSHEFQSTGDFPSQYELAIEKFEQQWFAGLSPRIEDFLPSDSSREAVLAELLIAEIEFRLKAQEDASLMEYLRRFPELTANRELQIRIACEEYRFKNRRNSLLTATDFASHFPLLEPELGNALRRDPRFVANEALRAQTDRGSVRAELGARISELEWLAKGGMGEVWLAKDATLKRQVAMKVIQSKHRRNAEALQRFMAEAEITSRLEHPGVAPIYGLGEHADGRPCYAMRFIRGESMGEAARRFFRRDNAPSTSAIESAHGSGGAGGDESTIRNRLDLHQGSRNLIFRGLLHRLVAVSHTVAYAHDRGVLHRDLKPENIRLGEHGETILLDWGLAKDLDQDFEIGEAIKDPHSGQFLDKNSDDVEKTKIGSLYGTPQFMSPEQAKSNGAPLTFSVDIYGLGTTLYYLLTGRAPFPRETPSKVIDRVIAGDFRPPRSICRDAPPALEAICLKAMKSEPAARYASAQEFANDLERYLADQPVSVHQDNSITHIRRWVMRHRTYAAIAATACIAMAGLLLTWVVIAQKHSRDLAVKNLQLGIAKQLVDEALSVQTELSLELAKKNSALEAANVAANRAAKEAREQRDAANLRSEQVIGLTNSLVEMVGAAGPDGFRSELKSGGSPKSPSQISAPEYLDHVVEQVDAKFDPDDPTRGEVLAAVGQTKRSMGLFEAAAPVLEEALRIRRLSAGADDQKAASIEFDLAWSVLEIQGRAHEAEKHFRNVIAVRQVQSPRDEIGLGLAQAGMLWSLYVQGKSEGELLFALGNELGAAGLVKSISIARVFVNLRQADTARARRDWAEGDRLFKQASEEIDQLVPPDHPFLAARDFTLAGYLRDRGDMRAAQEYVQRGLKIYRERVGIHTYMADPLYHIAKYREHVGDYEEAEALHREAYWLASLNPNTMRSFRDLTTQGLGDFLLKVGKHDELQELIEIELNGPNAAKGLDADELLARRIWSWMETGDFEQVITHLSGNSRENPRLPNSTSILCRALFEAGRFEEARQIGQIDLHLTEHDYLPRSSPSFAVQMQRLSRGDARSLAEVEAGVPASPVARDHSATVQALRWLAGKQMENQDFSGAAKSLQEAWQIAAKRMSTFDRAYIDLMFDEAILKLASGDRPAAIHESRRAMEAVSARYPKGAIMCADFLHQAGLIAHYAGDATLARQRLDEAIAIRTKRWNGGNIRVWNPVLDRIEATPDLEQRRDYIRDQIRQMFIQGVPGWRIAVLLRELGAVQRRLGAHSDAERSLKDAWQVFLPMLGESHVLSNATATELAIVCQSLNRQDEARSWRDRAAAP
jgi:serine/threonine protein kinase